MKPEAQPCHRQDSRQAKDAPGRTSPKGDGADSASPRDDFTDLRPDAGKADPPRTGENALAAPCCTRFEAWTGSAIVWPCGMSLARPSRPRKTNHQRRGRFVHAQPVAANRGVAPRPARCGGVPSKAHPRQQSPIAMAHQVLVRHPVTAWQKTVTGAATGCVALIIIFSSVIGRNRPIADCLNLLMSARSGDGAAVP